MGRSKLQGTPWHYEYNYKMLNNPKKVMPYEYPYSHKTCYFDNHNVCKNTSCKHFNSECRGFELCSDFSLTGKPAVTRAIKKNKTHIK